MKAKKIIGTILSAIILSTTVPTSNCYAQGACLSYADIPEDIYCTACLVEMETGVSACLLCAIAYEESRFDNLAENKNCKGLMQINVVVNKQHMIDNNMTDWTNTYQSMYNAATLLLEFQEDEEDDLTLALYKYGGWDYSEYLQTGKLNSYVSKLLERSYEYETATGRH